MSGVHCILPQSMVHLMKVASWDSTRDTICNTYKHTCIYKHDMYDHFEQYFESVVLGNGTWEWYLGMVLGNGTWE